MLFVVPFKSQSGIFSGRMAGFSLWLEVFTKRVYGIVSCPDFPWRLEPAMNNSNTSCPFFALVTSLALSKMAMILFLDGPLHHSGLIEMEKCKKRDETEAVVQEWGSMSKNGINKV